MAKFKVGDKVRVKRDLNGCFGVFLTMEKNRGRTVTIAHCDGTSMMQYKICEDDKNLWWDESVFEPVEKREFIVIRRSGTETIAELRHDREVIKSAVATCSEKDTFDFETGAKLAFDRLMGREEVKKKSYIEREFKIGDRVITSYGVGEVVDVDHNETSMPYRIMYDKGYKYWSYSGTAKPEPKPAHRFKVGDRVQEVKAGYGIGEVIEVDTDNKTIPYRVKFDGGNVVWLNENRISPAPEPPKKSRFPLSEEELDKVLYEIREVARQQREREERGDV